MRGERRVAGLWCSEVLARLERAVEGTLADDERRQVEAHVAECPACAQFGARYAELVDALRLRASGAADEDEQRRATRVLDAVWRTVDDEPSAQ